MFKQRKFILSLLLVCALVTPFLARAVTIDELKAQIATLLLQVANLQKQIATLQGGSVAWCHTFNTNLGMGIASNSNEVEALQKALGMDGIWEGAQCGVSDICVYDEQTASYVVAFQEKYYSEILKPLGLLHGTGYVGSSTRAKLNKLYGCNNGRVCATDLKLCPDGSYVGRGPNCEFSQCASDNCVKEGGSYGNYPSANFLPQKSCCSGLKSVITFIVENGECHMQTDSLTCIVENGECHMQTDSLTCTYCGNGVCGLGENTCNCPVDCK